MIKECFATYEQINYKMFRIENEVTPYVCAYGYDPVTDEWEHGHYFYSLYGAVQYINQKLKEYAEA